MRKLLYTIFFLFFLSAVTAQTITVTDAGKMNDFVPIASQIFYYSDFSGTTTINNLKDAVFNVQGTPAFDERHLSGTHFLKIVLNNSGPLDTFWLYMGRAQLLNMYELDSISDTFISLDNKLEISSSVLMNTVPYYQLTVPTGQQKTFYVQAILKFYNWQQLDPVLVKPAGKTAFEFDHLLKPSRLYMALTLPMLGIMLSMFIYTLLLFFESGRREYFYCAASIFVFFIYFLLRLLNLYIFSSWYYFLYDFRYQALQLGGNMLILYFLVSFLRVKELVPRLYWFFKLSIWVQIIFLVINIPITYINQYNFIGEIAFDVIRILILICSVFLVFALLKINNEKEARYLAAGSFLAIIILGLALAIDRWSNLDYLLIRNSGLSVLVFMLGVLLQNFLFLRALSFRSRKEEAERVIAVEQLQLENDRNELEKYRAIIDARENERNRISQEIHDDIGSGLTSIRLLSEIAKAKTNQRDWKELDKISSTSNILMDKMNEIIWTLNSRNDTLPNLVAYLRHQIVEYFEPLQMQLHLTVPELIPEFTVNGKTRRNILLAVKEALHNIVKHSGATDVQVIFEVSSFLEIMVQDNGVGFNKAEVSSFKNGLYNMRDRLNALGGSCDVTIGKGTRIVMKIPLSTYPV